MQRLDIHHSPSRRLCCQCDEWITARWAGAIAASHLDDIESLPVQCNPLTFRRTIAAAGYCLFCLFNKSLKPEKRFRQYLDRSKWKRELDRHFDELEKKEEELAQTSGEEKATPCP